MTEANGMDFGALSSRLSRRLAGLLLAGTVLAAPALAQEQAPEDPAVFADPLAVPAADGDDGRTHPFRQPAGRPRRCCG